MRNKSDGKTKVAIKSYPACYFCIISNEELLLRKKKHIVKLFLKIKTIFMMQMKKNCRKIIIIKLAFQTTRKKKVSKNIINSAHFFL